MQFTEESEDHLERLEQMLSSDDPSVVLEEYFLSTKQRRASVIGQNELQRKTVTSSGTGEHLSLDHLPVKVTGLGNLGSVVGNPGKSFSDAEAKVERAKASAAQAEVTLFKLLQNDVALKLFFLFCKSRYAAENLLFWVDVECFQNINWKPVTLLGIGMETKRTTRVNSGCMEQFMEEEALRIYKRYLSDLAENQICLTSTMASKVSLLETKMTAHLP